VGVNEPKNAIARGVAKPHYTVKKAFSIFPFPAGMSLTKLSLGSNNLYMTSRLWTGISKSFFTV
jgi:hypothetical protein